MVDVREAINMSLMNILIAIQTTRNEKAQAHLTV
jgi:hypothetical protein